MKSVNERTDFHGDADERRGACGLCGDVHQGACAPALHLQDEVRIVKGPSEYGKWKRITSLSENFVCLDGGQPASRRTMEKMIRAGRVEHRPISEAVSL